MANELHDVADALDQPHEGTTAYGFLISVVVVPGQRPMIAYTPRQDVELDIKGQGPNQREAGLALLGKCLAGEAADEIKHFFWERQRLCHEAALNGKSYERPYDPTAPGPEGTDNPTA